MFQCNCIEDICLCSYNSYYNKNQNYLELIKQYFPIMYQVLRLSSYFLNEKKQEQSLVQLFPNIKEFLHLNFQEYGLVCPNLLWTMVIGNASNKEFEYILSLSDEKEMYYNLTSFSLFSILIYRTCFKKCNLLIKYGYVPSHTDKIVCKEYIRDSLKNNISKNKKKVLNYVLNY